MPQIKNIPGPYHIYFASFDCAQPAHVHVASEKAEAKFWLNSVEVALNQGFRQPELNRIRKLITKHHAAITESWNEHCNQG